MAARRVVALGDGLFQCALCDLSWMGEGVTPNTRIRRAAGKHWARKHPAMYKNERPPARTPVQRRSYNRRRMRLSRTGVNAVVRCRAMVLQNGDLYRCNRMIGSPRIRCPLRHQGTCIRLCTPYSKADAMENGVHGGTFVEIAQSSIPGAGRGVFARTWFIKGDYISLYEGVEYSNIQDIPEEYRDRVYRLKSNLFLVGLLNPEIKKGLACFTNQSLGSAFTANARLVLFRNTVSIRAICTIAPGTEILVHYNW